MIFLGRQLLRQEPCPIVGLDRVQIAHHIFKRVGHGDRTGIAVQAEETNAKVIQGFFAVALLTNDGVDLQPEQFALRIIVDAATPIAPLAAGFV